MKRPCECLDPQCDHAAYGHGDRTRRYYRVDMDGTYLCYFCDECGGDALASWLFESDRHNTTRGYAPDDLEEALLDWVNITLPDGPRGGPPTIRIDWEVRTFEWLCEQLWDCDDTLPSEALGDLEKMLGLPLTTHTYAAAVRALMAHRT
jgi:hypothetical protein